jgi:hypothetical protein
MNYEDVLKIVDEVTGSASFLIDTTTDVKLTGGKKNVYQGRVKKRVENSQVVVYNRHSGNGYAELVKEQMVREGKDPEEFVLKPRAWGERITNTPFVVHKEKYYIECVFEQSGETTILLDGEVTDEEIEGMPVKKVSTTVAQTESQGGIEEKVIIRTFSVESISKMSLKIEDMS